MSRGLEVCQDFLYWGSSHQAQWDYRLPFKKCQHESVVLLSLYYSSCSKNTAAKKARMPPAAARQCSIKAKKHVVSNHDILPVTLIEKGATSLVHFMHWVLRPFLVLRDFATTGWVEGVKQCQHNNIEMFQVETHLQDKQLHQLMKVGKFLTPRFQIVLHSWTAPGE